MTKYVLGAVEWVPFKMTRTYEGLLSLHSLSEIEDVLFLSSVKFPLAQELEWLNGKQVTIRYWLANKPVEKEEAISLFLHGLTGAPDVTYCPRYSEITGYLWTDEKLNIGGHNLIDELKSNVGKWLILEIECHKQKVPAKL